MSKNYVKIPVESTLFDSISIENRKHISEELFEKLRDAILSGELPAGYVFPNENELCQKLNIGRGSLREAYSRLETLHMITRSKTGTYVNSQEQIQNTMNFEAIAQRSETQNLAEYRQVVEVGTVRLAALKASEKDIAALDRILGRMEEAVEDPAQMAQLDFDFHSALVRIAHNELLLIMFNTIRAIYEDYTESVFAQGYCGQSLLDHRAIIDALRAGDAELAGAMMQRHLDHVERFRDEN
ncbi:MAG: FadR family transcriptional regulator [Oscillibacter sp.]|nr:FadR family transcriptional regulator [Oscillibacter sp.]